MTANRREPKSVLERAVQAMRSDEPAPEVLAHARAAGERFLFGASETSRDVAPIDGCSDIQSLLVAYRQGKLKGPRALLVRHHLVECAHCREVWNRRGALRLASTPWRRSAEPHLESTANPRRIWVALAAAVALCVAVVALRLSYYGVPTGRRATVEAISGSLYRIDGAASEPLRVGATLDEGQTVRAGNAPQSTLRLADGSRVELGERAEFSVEMRGRDTTLHLGRGQIIVQAEKRRSGHLYVATPDCRVAVTGTVFSVMAGLKGSRVSVIEGEVRVAQRTGLAAVLHRGDQVTTDPALSRIPIEQEVSWSRNLDDHLALLREMTELKKTWDAVKLPELRYSSWLATLVPEETVLFATLPNYGETMADGYRLFISRLAQGGILERWWEGSELGKHRERLDALVAKLHGFSEFLGDELTLTVSGDASGEQVLVLAEVKKAGLREFLDREISATTHDTTDLAIVDETRATNGALANYDGPVLLVTEKIAALSLHPRAITELLQRLHAPGAPSFEMTPLGDRVFETYQEGVSVFVAADLEMLAESCACGASPGSHEAQSGARYLSFERKPVSGQMLSTGVVEFGASRRGVASWLAAPAPMGSLGFFTSQASAVAAFVVKDPVAVVDDIIRLFPSRSVANAKLTGIQADWNVRLREDVAEALGSEIAVALDGPILPEPAWKLVVEVQDVARLEHAIETFARRIDQEMQNAGEGSLRIEHSPANARSVHRVFAVDAKLPFEVNYAFVDGYLVATPTRAMLLRGLEARTRGETLARQRRFTSLLPRDGHESLSGVVFQDLLGVVAAALDHAETGLSAQQRQGFEALRMDARPSLIGFYGHDDRIEMAGVGDLLAVGPEALALPGILHHTFPATLAAFRK